MALVLVTGGTGTLGRALVPQLIDAGHAVRVLSRQSAPSLPPGATAVVGDLRTGDGLADALVDVDVIAHCASSPFRRTHQTDVEGTRRLVAAASAGSGALPHLVYVSIVGVDRIPFPYYRQKFAAEKVVIESGLPWTILRATQFHQLLDYMFSRMPGALFAFRGLRFQVLDAAECATRMAALVGAPPAGRVADMGGPIARPMVELAREYRQARGWRRPLVSMPAPGKAARALKAGANLCLDHPDGTLTWEQWLAETYAR
jgi:uncharacterized protein YbjT (DUF2867 family)